VRSEVFALLLPPGNSFPPPPPFSQMSVNFSFGRFPFSPYFKTKVFPSWAVEVPETQNLSFPPFVVFLVGFLTGPTPSSASGPLCFWDLFGRFPPFLPGIPPGGWRMIFSPFPPFSVLSLQRDISSGGANDRVLFLAHGFLTTPIAAQPMVCFFFPPHPWFSILAGDGFSCSPPLLFQYTFSSHFLFPLL